MGDLVLLTECADALEAAQLKGLLDAHGVSCVVQGETHAALLAGALGGHFIEPRVLVSPNDLERARELLEAVPQEGGPAGEALGDGVCPVHEGPAVATCARCGTFLCTQCTTVGEPPVCEDCVQHESIPQRASKPVPGWVRALPYLAVPLLIAAAVAGRSLSWW